MIDLQDVTLESEEKRLAAESVSNEFSVAEYVKRWGDSASIVLLDPSCRIFRSQVVTGIIGYRLESGCAVVLGDPLCEWEDNARLTEEFHEFCEQEGLKVIYVTASERFAKWAIGNVCHSLIEVGEELILDTYSNPKSGSKGRALRNKVNNSLRAGITIHEYREWDCELEKEIEQVGKAWLNARQGPQIYLAQMQLFSEREGKRWFYAEYEGKVIGVLLLHYLEARQGWLVQFLMTIPSAPMGTSEQLVVSAAQYLKQESCRFLSFGVAQIESLGEIIGLGKISQWIARFAFKGAKRLFHLDMRRRYWKKFQPYKEPSYLLFSSRRIGITEVRSIMRALNVSL